MEQRLGGGVPRVWLRVSCALALVACSSQGKAPGTDGGGSAEVNDAASLDAGDATRASNCDVNCAPINHVLTQQAAPKDCTFTIGLVPPDPSNVRVRNGTAAIPPGATDGWSYEPGMMAITLNGSYCVSARNGTITSLTMLFGCPSCPIP